MGIFDHLDQVISRTVDTTFGDAFTYIAVEAAPNGRPIADQARPAWQGKGILSEAPIYDSIEIGKRDRSGNDLNTLHAGTSLELSVDRHAYPKIAQAKQQDRLNMRGKRYQVVSVQPDGLARIVLSLVLVK